MDKVKLAICMQDLEYQERFVNCLMNHYRHQYEMHVFTDVEELKESNLFTYSSVIMDEYTIEKMANFVEGGVKLICLKEAEYGDEEDASENIICTGKYQEVYKISEMIQKITHTQRSLSYSNLFKKWIGIYSFTKVQFQIPVSTLLAELYGEKERVIIIDLQPFSGLLDMDVQVSRMGLEDILAVASTGNYSKARLLECIGHETNWDYVYPVRNSECLLECTAKLFETALEILEKELGYERIIINFGIEFSGWMDILTQCEDVLFLTGKELDRNWREKAFCDELQRRDMECIYNKVKHIEVPSTSPSDGKWQTILEKWRYGIFAEGLRQSLSKERKDGEAM